MIIALGIVLFIGIMALAIAGVILNGWVLSILWGWFVVPIFHLPTLRVIDAIAIALIARVLTHQYIPSKDKDYYAPWMVAFLGPFAALGTGWVIKQYM